MDIHLKPRCTPGATVTPTANGWRLAIPPGRRGTYRLSQLDDYATHPRRLLPHSPPLTLNLRARVSAVDLPGTWGFGLWNDPFSVSFGLNGMARRLPALPQTAWYFHASPPNHLALRTGIPARGFFAGTFRSPRIPSLLLAPGLLALPLLALRPVSRLLRRVASRIAVQDGVPVNRDFRSLDVTLWHEYTIEWRTDTCTFRVDGQELLRTSVTPPGPLGLVLWIDNQYAAWDDEGRVGYRTLENEDAWMEIENLQWA